MATMYLKGYLDSWYANVGGSNYGNGSGSRLQVGRMNVSGVAWTNRVGITFSDNLSTGEETVTQVLLRIKIKGSESCAGNGSNPNVYIERVADKTERVAENAESGTCVVTGGGAATYARYPGPTTTTTNRVQWNPASVTAGTEYEIDITDMFLDWWAVRDFYPNVPYYDVLTDFSIVIKAVDETNTNHRIAIHSEQSGGGAMYEGGSGPELLVTYTNNDPPDTPVQVGPTGRINGSTTWYYEFDWSDPDGDLPGSVYIQMSSDATFATFPGSSWDSGWVTPTLVSGSRYRVSHGGTAPVRGTTYYWRIKARDPSLDTSAYSGSYTFKLNRLPSAGSRDPG